MKFNINENNARNENKARNFKIYKLDMKLKECDIKCDTHIFLSGIIHTLIIVYWIYDRYSWFFSFIWKGLRMYGSYAY